MTAFTSLLDLGISGYFTMSSLGLLSSLEPQKLFSVAQWGSFAWVGLFLPGTSHTNHSLLWSETFLSLLLDGTQWIKQDELYPLFTVIYLCLPFFSTLSTQAIGFIVFSVYSSLCSVYPWPMSLLYRIPYGNITSSTNRVRMHIHILHMWQSRVEIEHYSVVYFARITAIEAL